jgi:hypothetical protein
VNSPDVGWALSLAVLASAVAAAQPAPRNYYSLPNEKEEQSWNEQKTELPPFPEAGSLVKVPVDGGGGFDYFVDLESVRVGTDGVVRYTLVARSDTGATNIAYEGIRCKGRERKLYAFGRADKTWSLARNPQWSSISDLPVNRVQAMLHDSIFCPARIIVRDIEEARKLLKRGGDPRAGGSVDMWNQPR